TVRPRMFRKIVVDNQRIPAFPHEEFAHGAARKRGEVPQWRRVLCGDGDHDGVLHRPFLLQDVDHLGNRRRLLADGDVDADQITAALIDDRVQRHGGLARLAVANDQLTLPTADGDHRVDGLDARLHRRVHRRAQHHARRDHLDWPCRHRAWQRALAIQRRTERIDYATDQLGSHWYRGNATG